MERTEITEKHKLKRKSLNTDLIRRKLKRRNRNGKVYQFRKKPLFIS